MVFLLVHASDGHNSRTEQGPLQRGPYIRGHRVSSGHVTGNLTQRGHLGSEADEREDGRTPGMVLPCKEENSMESGVILSLQMFFHCF